jgi:hypothetical protein
MDVSALLTEVTRAWEATTTAEAARVTTVLAAETSAQEATAARDSAALCVMDAKIGLSHLVLRPNLNALPLCVSGSSFTHKATNNKINSITSVYYIESHKTYYKTKRSKQQNKAPCQRQRTGGPHT